MTGGPSTEALGATEAARGTQFYLEERRPLGANVKHRVCQDQGSSLEAKPGVGWEGQKAGNRQEE